MSQASRWLIITSISAVVLLIALSASRLADDTIPHDLDSFELAEGFQIELIASEPQLSDPVAMEIDENGNMYVAEMPGYPLDISGKGRIRILQDTDNDGRMDNSVIFAEDIVLPTGLMRWKNGLLVTAPPDVLYLEDTDGDHKADIREVMITGFARSNPQHNFNKPEYGLDNWIYVANNGIIWTSAYKEQFGGRGEEVYFTAQPASPRLVKNGGNRNVRFKPDSFQLESLAGRSQFGHTFDPWGHHFLVSNATPQYHEVIAARYLARNPALSTRMAMQYTPTYGRNTVIYPITRDPEHQLLTDRGMLTSAAGITYYAGELFPEKYQHSTFIGESVHNLVHVLKVKEKGATFEASRIEERKEFLASTDSWFRPVNFYVGPDGALYVVDYYRQIVEHPEWMDDETAKSGKLQNGTESGRIYRVTPTGTAPAEWFGKLNMSSASSAELVEHLKSPEAWWRRTAQRLLVDRQDHSSVPLLEALLQSDSDMGRLHALWTLKGLNKLSAKHIQGALADEVAGNRENAIILAELHAETSPELWNALLAMKDESNPRVRFQLLCTLGFLDSEESRLLRQKLLTQDIEDEWVQLASLTTHGEVDVSLFKALQPTLISSQSEGRKTFISRIAAIIASAKHAQALEELYTLTLTHTNDNSEWWKQALFDGMGAGLPNSALLDQNLIALRNVFLNAFLDERGESMRNSLLNVLTSLPGSPDDEVKRHLPDLRRHVQNTNASPSSRAQTISLLAHLSPKEHIDFFKSLLVTTMPTPVQHAAIKAYGATGTADVPEVLIGSWPTLTPDLRNTALDVLMKRQAWMASVLDAVEAGTIQPSALGWNRTVVLMRDTAGEVKEKARRLLSEPAGVRDQVVASYYESLTLDGDLENGRSIFQRVCSACHQVGGALGTAFGPDLGTVRHWSAKALLAKILKPQSTIADGYGLWSIKLDDRTEIGLIATESSSSIMLRRQGHKDLAISREDVKELQSLNTTAMPAGLETQISTQEMADLIAFMRFN